MRTITSVEEVEIRYKDDDLLYDKWIPFVLLSEKLAVKETEGKMAYKSLRNKLYNALKGKKLNVNTFAGITCIDVENPMKAAASIKFNFVKE